MPVPISSNILNPLDEDYYLDLQQQLIGTPDLVINIHAFFAEKFIRRIWKMCYLLVNWRK